MSEPVRLRVVFEDAGLLRGSQRRRGLQRCWLQLRPGIDTIADLAAHLHVTFGLQNSCPHGLIISMGGFVLPSFESTCILKDEDIIMSAFLLPFSLRKLVDGGETIVIVDHQSSGLVVRIEKATAPIILVVGGVIGRFEGLEAEGNHPFLPGSAQESANEVLWHEERNITGCTFSMSIALLFDAIEMATKPRERSSLSEEGTRSEIHLMKRIDAGADLSSKVPMAKKPRVVEERE
ncbi:hypothetical protein M5K25_008396 [Dendrobium thyrsiflorum]|uniref:Coilin N-terminal domain-containing protein n=1 Tax=Dendrobium thyrsiflorum TaxID=117978 RepID=A0ABD0V7X2_DENTH